MLYAALLIKGMSKAEVPGLLPRKKVDSAGAPHFQRAFCNRYRQQGELRIVIMEDKSVLIDSLSCASEAPALTLLA